MATPKEIRVFKPSPDWYDSFCRHGGEQELGTAEDDLPENDDLFLCPRCTRLVAAGVPVKRMGFAKAGRS